MIRKCSQRPCGKNEPASDAEPAPLSPSLDPRGSRAEELRRSWQRSHLLKIREEMMGKGQQENASVQASRQLILLAQPGDTQLPRPPHRGRFPHIRQAALGLKGNWPARKQLVLANKTQRPRQKQSKREPGNAWSEEPLPP